MTKQQLYRGLPVSVDEASAVMLNMQSDPDDSFDWHYFENELGGKSRVRGLEDPRGPVRCES